jgi:E3 ubiquitin-protein ligase SHPRH
MSINSSTEKDDGDEMDKNSRVRACRQRLRAALEVLHMCIFFTGNAYYQIKSDPKLTSPDSEEYQKLEKAEEEAYEAAKAIRKEMLTEILPKVGRYMKMIHDKSKEKSFTNIPMMKPQLYSLGLEGRRLLTKLEDYCEAMNRHVGQFNQWRDDMVKLLLQSLIDEEEDVELEGNEYETSTKHQDEMYVYMEAIRAMFADRHDAITGENNSLIAHEVERAIAAAKRGEGPAPHLYLSIMDTRSAVKPSPQLGSLRGIVGDIRTLVTSLEWQESGGSSRARAELEIVSAVLDNVGRMATEQTKINSSLEREVEMFRDTMNYRLDYYRQLQQISDTVAPYDEQSVGKPFNEDLFAAKLQNEATIDTKLSALRAKRRYLIHLRDESGADENSKICIICQSSFEIGEIF